MVGFLGREIMLAPDLLARAAASTAARTRAEQWILCQPRSIRQSFVYQVLDAGNDDQSQRIWMLRQSAAVRESYLREVERLEGARPEVEWMLRQPDEVRESFIREVVQARPRQPPRPA